MLQSLFLMAQQTPITGTVTDEAGDPLIGATIIEKGTTNGTVTDLNGAFRIRPVGKTPVLTISYIGYDVKEMQMAPGGSYTIQLAEGASLDAVTIVGSRTLNRSYTTSASPVDVIDISELTTKNGQLDINTLLNYVAPSFNANRQTGSDGADHIDPASLRGLGPDQTLVLINGKRLHQTSLVNIYGSRGRGNNGTDLNAIPAASIKRIEILRDGASAQYGSDAIAGVINIVLKDETNLFEANVNAGAYTAKYRRDDDKFDGLNYNLNANYGFKVGNKGFINLTGDYNWRDHTNRSKTHPDSIISRREFGDAKLSNASLYLNSKFPINNTTQIYVFGGINHRSGEAFAWTRFKYNSDGDLEDRNDTLIYPNGFDPIITSKILDYTGTLGLKKSFGKWQADLSNTYGANDFTYGVKNTLNASWVATPAQPLSPTEFDAGGFKLSQNTTNLDISRTFKKFEAINLAFGAEFRLENYAITAGEEGSYLSYDQEGAPGSQGFPGFQPSDELSEGRNCVGAYVDTEFDFTTKFMMGAAARFENYSDFGATINGKLSAIYKFSPYFSLRGTASTGYRAPSLPQIYYNQTVTNFEAGQPVEVVVANNASTLANELGIPDLKQERSLNGSLGFTSRPFDNFSITVDGYAVKVKDRVILTGAFGFDDDSLTLNPVETILTAANAEKVILFTNSISTTTRGLDAVLAYSASFNKSRLNTSLAANFNKLVIDSVYTNDLLADYGDIYFDMRERYFAIAAAPKSKINLTLDHTYNNKCNTVLRFTRFGAMEIADWWKDETQVDRYKARITTDLSFGYTIKEKVKLVVGANNLFNVYPYVKKPSVLADVYVDGMSNPADTESGGAWDPVQMGNNGRFLFIRTNWKF